MGTKFNKTAYEWEFTVKSFDVDMFNRLKLSSLMKYQQEIGGMHLYEFGTTAEKMRKEQNLGFIFTKMNIKIDKLPKTQDKVILRTWCSGLKGVRFTRNYIMFDSLGNIMTQAKVEVTTLDLLSRKIVRPSTINGFCDFLYNDDLENGAEYPSKITIPMDISTVYSHKVRFCDIDYNKHVNNTVYADLSLNCLDPEILKKAIKGFEVNFSNEVLTNQTIEVAKAEISDGFVFTGTVSDRQCFTALLKI